MAVGSDCHRLPLFPNWQTEGPVTSVDVAAVVAAGMDTNGLHAARGIDTPGPIARLVTGPAADAAQGVAGMIGLAQLIDGGVPVNEDILADQRRADIAFALRPQDHQDLLRGREWKRKIQKVLAERERVGSAKIVITGLVRRWDHAAGLFLGLGTVDDRITAGETRDNLRIDRRAVFQVDFGDQIQDVRMNMQDDKLFFVDQETAGPLGDARPQPVHVILDRRQGDISGYRRLGLRSA